MVPAAEHKGSALALLVDIMSGGVAGSNFSFEASGFGGTVGGPPDVGQVVLAIDPTATMGDGFVDRIETELRALSAEPGARLPGDRRLGHRAVAATDGVEVPDDLMALLLEYAEHGSPARRPDDRRPDGTTRVSGVRDGWCATVPRGSAAPRWAAPPRHG